jgi:hypothetical protein
MNINLACLSTALATGILGMLPLAAWADSTAELVLNLQCRGGYDVQVWRNYSSGALLYRSQGPLGELALDGGTAQDTEGTRVYRFRNDNYAYWVWDGTLDSAEAGTLEVYQQEGYILMQEPCRKV